MATILDTQFLSRPSSYVIGVDEVGRGALAGPISACAFALTPEMFQTIQLGEAPVIRDSKRMSPLQRERAYEWLDTHLGAKGNMSIIHATAVEIDAVGIQAANIRVMKDAVQSVLSALAAGDSQNKPAVTIISDNVAFHTEPHHRFLHIPKAESQSVAVAAASICAKVTRDSLMTRLHADHSLYGWNSNKGYGSAGHIEAIKTHGKTPHHRKSFISHIVA